MSIRTGFRDVPNLQYSQILDENDSRSNSNGLNHLFVIDNLFLLSKVLYIFAKRKRLSGLPLVIFLLVR